MKFILQSVGNYKRVIYELKGEQRLIDLFLKNSTFCIELLHILSHRVVSGVQKYVEGG